MNITIDMGEILTKAWKIVWKFRVLWIFGILAGCGANNTTNINNAFNNNFSNGLGSGTRPNGNIPTPSFNELMNSPQMQEFRAALNQYLWVIGLVIVLLCVLWLFFYSLGIMGKIGLIQGAGKADAGAETLTFGELWTESLPYFWRMFGLAFLVGLPFFIVGVLTLVVLLVGLYGLIVNDQASSGALGGYLAALAVVVPVMCCLGLLRIVVDLLVTQAQNAIVLEDKGVLESLRRGWEVFKRSFLTIILIAVIVGVLGGIVGFVLAIPLILILAPVFVAGFMATTKSDAFMVPLLISGACCLAYLPVLWVLGGILRSYTQSVWTLTYLRLTAPAPALESADAA